MTRLSMHPPGLQAWALAAGLAVAVSLTIALDNLPVAVLAVVGIFFLRLLLAGPWPVVMVWLIGMPTAFVFINNALIGVQFLKAERGAFVLAIALVQLRALFKKAPLLPFDSVERAMLMLLGVFTVSMLVGAPGKQLADFVKLDVSYLLDGYAMPMFAYMIVRRCEWRERRISIFLALLSLVGIFLAITAVLQLYAGVTAFQPEYGAVLHLKEERATGVFTGAVEFGAVAATCLLVAGAFRYWTSSIFMRLAMAMVMVVILGAVLLSKTRGVWVGMLASLAFLYMHDARGRPFMNVLAVAGCLAGLLVLPLVLDIDKLSHRFMDLVPIYNRLAAWATAANMGMQNPLGVGFSRNGFGDAKDAYFVSFGPVSSLWAADLSVPHNEFLNLLALTGIPGLALYIMVLVRTYRVLMTIWARHSQSLHIRTLALYSAAALIGVIINGLFVDIGKFMYLYTLLFALAGVATVAEKNQQTGGGARLASESGPDALPS